jgi:hypothetical protein
MSFFCFSIILFQLYFTIIRYKQELKAWYLYFYFTFDFLKIKIKKIILNLNIAISSKVAI